MRRLLPLFMLLICCGALALERPQGRPRPAARADAPVRFEAVDIWIDAGSDPLTAWQVAVRYDATRVQVIGVEGGEPQAFRAAPFYDPAGMEQGRIILAAFTADHAAAPAGLVRVGRLHLRVQGRPPHGCKSELVTAGTVRGQRIIAFVDLAEARPQ